MAAGLLCAAVEGVYEAIWPIPALALADQFTIRNGVGAGDNSSAGISIAGDGFSLSFNRSSTGRVSDLGAAFCTAECARPSTVLTFEDPLATPEPSTFMLVGLGAAALARRRMRRGTA